jgi:hypothetical protein
VDIVNPLFTTFFLQKKKKGGDFMNPFFNDEEENKYRIMFIVITMITFIFLFAMPSFAEGEDLPEDLPFEGEALPEDVPYITNPDVHRCEILSNDDGVNYTQCYNVYNQPINYGGSGYSVGNISDNVGKVLLHVIFPSLSAILAFGLDNPVILIGFTIACAILGLGLFGKSRGVLR